MQRTDRVERRDRTFSSAANWSAQTGTATDICRDATPPRPCLLSTHSLPPRRQLGSWNDWAEENWRGISISRRGSGFPAELIKLKVGGVNFSRVRTCDSVVRRKPISPGSPGMILHFQLGGGTRNRQARREAALGTGDMTLLRIDDTYELETSGDCDLLVAEFAEQALRDRVGAAAIRGAIELKAEQPGVALVGQMIASLCRSEVLPQDSKAETLLERSFLDMVALAVMARPETMAGHGHGALFRRATAEIEKQRGNLDITGCELAANLGVSQRALQMAFAEAGTTPSAYLMSERLKLAASRIASEAASITEIALECGFSSSAHFSRCFSRQFGVSPRHFRRS